MEPEITSIFLNGNLNRKAEIAILLAKATAHKFLMITQQKDHSLFCWPKITDKVIPFIVIKKNEKRAKISPERVASQKSSKCRTEKVHVLDNIQRFFGMPVDYRFISGSLMTANNNGSTHSILMHNKYHILCKLQHGDEYEETKKKYSSSGREDCFNFCPTKRWCGGCRGTGW